MKFAAKTISLSIFYINLSFYIQGSRWTLQAVRMNGDMVRTVETERMVSILLSMQEKGKKLQNSIVNVF